MFKREDGVALISVLLIVAILLAITSRLMTTHNLVINQHQNTFEQDQALQYVLGAEVLAQQALLQDFTQFGAEQDHLGEVWAREILPFELDEGGFLEAQLTDLHGCFNLNRVVGSNGASAIVQAKQLMTNLSLQPDVIDGWKDWVDSDDQITGLGAEDSEYLLGTNSGTNGYRTPNLPVTHFSELNLIRGIDAEHINAMRPHFCLLPDTDTLLNINTASPQALASLDRALNVSEADSVAATERAYTSVSDFTRDYSAYEPVAAFLSTTSEFFQLHAQATVGETSVTLLSLLRRDTSTGEVTVLQRDFGKLFVSNLQIDTQVQGN